MATPAEDTERATAPSDENVKAFCDVLDQMRVSMSSARDLVKTLREKCVHILPLSLLAVPKRELAV